MGLFSNKMKNIVTIGGGTGSFVLLSGLKNYPVKLSAIVSMADDGGSTGVLRDELGVLPPGDVRQCLVALSDSSDKMRELMNYRFEEGRLKGHSFGNLFLSALEKINGNFSNGIEEAIKILNVRGEVIPVTDANANLYLELNNKKILKGENEINHNYEIEREGIRKIYLQPSAKANRKAIESIKKADLIVIGPGNFYCSIIPNLLVEGIADAICKSKATVVLNCNLVNKKGHTEKFNLDEYAGAVDDFLGKERIDFVTFNIKNPSQKLVERYEEVGEYLVRFNKEDHKKRKYKVLLTDLLSDKLPKFSKSDVLADKRSFIRHHPDKLAKAIIFLLEFKENQNIIRKII